MGKMADGAVKKRLNNLLKVNFLKCIYYILLKINQNSDLMVNKNTTDINILAKEPLVTN